MKNLKKTEVVTMMMQTGSEGSGNETSPQSERVRFAYGCIRWTYTKSPADGVPGGSISSSWDLGFLAQ